MPVKTETKQKGGKHRTVVYTVGHSTRQLPDFVQLLQAHGVTLLADVRSVPRSRHNPQFNRDTLPDALRSSGIVYLHLPGLGGLRRTGANSPNMGWRNTSFRGFADYMQTDEFARNLEHLIDLAQHERIALMCAEAVPWRCHRSLIADALLVRGLAIEHIMSDKQLKSHTLTPWARVNGVLVLYPAG